MKEPEMVEPLSHYEPYAVDVKRKCGRDKKQGFDIVICGFVA